MPQQHALVTGGAGFIGSHLCESLIEQGWRVTAVDDLSTGSLQNLAALETESRFALETASAADADRLRRAAAGADCVFHLASVVGVRRVMEDTVLTIEKNLHTMETVLEVCTERRLRLVTASSSEV